MSLTHETMLELMQYADGELDGEGRARVESLLRTSEEARGVVDAMGTLGDVVRAGVDARAETSGSAAADGIADGVMAAIAREASGATAQAKVVSLGQARPPRRSRAGATSAVVVVLALAAGIVLFVRSQAPAPTARDDKFSSPAPIVTTDIEAPSPSGSSREAVAQTEEPGVDLEEVRSIRNKVNVFFMPPVQTAGAAASVVVWIDDRHGGH